MYEVNKCFKLMKVHKNAIIKNNDKEIIKKQNIFNQYLDICYGLAYCSPG